jgi:predicted 3-demethylubiquinone-9 3-methyltransferase (glyoxalase superfamily)
MTTIQNNITPHLWFDKEAKEAAEFYASVFPESKITDVTTLHNTPSGDTDIVSFVLSGQAFMAISAGPLFKFNPSVSFIVNVDPSREKMRVEKSMLFGKSCLKAAWCSCRSSNTRSVSAMVGCRTNTGFRGRLSPQIWMR